MLVTGARKQQLCLESVTMKVGGCAQVFEKRSEQGARVLTGDPAEYVVEVSPCLLVQYLREHCEWTQEPGWTSSCTHWGRGYMD